MIIKTIERNRRFISLGNCGTLFLSIQGHRFIDEPIIKPTNIIRIFSLVNKHLIEQNLQLILIPSNRTPKETITFAKEYFNKSRLIIDNVDKRAYLSSLALSKYIVVTCDSSSMISEAALTGKPVYVAMIPPRRNDKRFNKFRSLFKELNIIKELSEDLTSWNYESLNETYRVASIIKDKIK